MSGIQGKVIAITGASAGIGALAARMLAERGAHVMLGARRLPRLAELAALIADDGGSARYLALDVGDRCATQRFISTAHAWFGRLDVIVNAAGPTCRHAGRWKRAGWTSGTAASTSTSVAC
ncbi:MAG: SDR family NAD(P)-dependent oxidoreductase [Burkholderiaceae bacterium]